MGESNGKNEKILSRVASSKYGESHALKGMSHDRAANLLCRRTGVRGSRCAQGNVYGDMRVPHTESQDRDRSSRTRESGGQFASVDSRSHVRFGLRGGVFGLSMTSGGQPREAQLHTRACW